MSTTQGVRLLTMEAGGNLNGKLYHVLTLDSNGRLVEADNANEHVVAILAQDPKKDTVAGDAVTVIDVDAGGIALVKAQSSFSAGNFIIPTSTAGKVDGASDPASGNTAIGFALQAATAADEIVRVKLGRSYN